MPRTHHRKLGGDTIGMYGSRQGHAVDYRLAGRAPSTRLIRGPEPGRVKCPHCEGYVRMSPSGLLRSHREGGGGRSPGWAACIGTGTVIIRGYELQMFRDIKEHGAYLTFYELDDRQFEAIARLLDLGLIREVDPDVDSYAFEAN